MSCVKDQKILAAATSLLVFIVVWLALVCHLPTALAQSPDTTDQPLSQEQLEQLVAPIALHPDSLLSQILMASTYPLEVVQAARWTEENPKVTGEALEAAMEKQPWDPSVKSLAAFPQALQMMNDELGWTQQLGDAFLAQQEDVLDAVQRLRAQADTAGNLKTTKEQKVEKQTVTAQSGKQETIIIVEQADPKVIYVPAYDPIVIYGPWRYPAYPPYYWYPPGYVAGRPLFWFATGVIVGRALWGRCDWRRRSVNININIYNSFNRTRITSPKWNHNPKHRRAVPYKGRDVAKRYGKGTRDVKSREQFRGRAEAGRRDLPRPGKGQLPAAGQRPAAGKLPGAVQRPATPQRPSAGVKPTPPKVRPAMPATKPVQRPAAPATRPVQRPAAPQRPSAGVRPAAPAARPAQRPAARPAPRSAQRPAARPSPAKRPAAYQGLGKGKQVRTQSSRGKQSRTISRPRPSSARPASRPSPSRSRAGGGRRR